MTPKQRKRASKKSHRVAGQFVILLGLPEIERRLVALGWR